MSDPTVHGVLRPPAVVLLVGAGALQLVTAPGGTRAHTAVACGLGIALVVAGLAVLRRPSVPLAWVAGVVASVAVAVWVVGFLGLRGDPDPVVARFLVTALVAAAAAGAAFGWAGSAASEATVPGLVGRGAVVAATFAVGASLGLVAAPTTASTTVLAAEASASSASATAVAVATDHHAAEGGMDMDGDGVIDMAADGTPIVAPDRGPQNADMDAEAAAVDGPLDEATRLLLADQLVLARATAMRYPTVADAQAAGLVRWGGYSQGAGSHYIVPAGGGGLLPDGTVDPARPGAYLYDGTNPTSRVVGLMYTSAPVDSTVASLGVTGPEPIGFAGDHDHWHRHVDSCMRETPDAVELVFAPDTGVTPELCTSAQGEYVPLSWWMLHVWVVPGWESPSGVFGHTNTALACAPGSIPDPRGYCEGS